MNRRTLLQTLAALPLCGWMRPKAGYGFVDVKRAQALSIFPCKVYDGSGVLIEHCRSFNDETGECTVLVKNEKGGIAVDYLKKEAVTRTFTAVLPLRIERIG